MEFGEVVWVFFWSLKIGEEEERQRETDSIAGDGEGEGERQREMMMMMMMKMLIISVQMEWRRPFRNYDILSLHVQIKSARGP